MAVAALGTWILTAGWGVYLLSRWLPGGLFRGRWGLLPGRLLYGHILLATAGLIAWVDYVLTDNYRAGWASFLALSIVAGLGYVRFVQWLPKYGQHAAREQVPGSPAARDFPYGAVLLHGMWAAVTLVLVLVTVLTRR
jgi:manganese efflux pump family protein